MGILKKLLGGDKATEVATPPQPAAATPPVAPEPLAAKYDICDVLIKHPEVLDDPVTIERITQGKPATERFGELFEQLRDRMDLGLAEDMERPAAIADKRANRMSGNNDRIWMYGNPVEVVHQAITKLDAERKTGVTGEVAPQEVAEPSLGAAADEVGTEAPARRKEKPAPSVEAVIRALQNKKGEPIDAGAISRFEEMLRASIAVGSPHAVFDDKATLKDQFRPAEVKAFRHAVNEVFGQRVTGLG